MTNTQKTKKIRKALQVYDRTPDGKYEGVEDDEGIKLETYDTDDNKDNMENENDMGYEMNEDPVTQALNDYKNRRSEQVYYPSSGDNIEEINYSQNVSDPDSEKTKEGQAFGFVRNKFDDSSDNYKNKLESKSRAYEDYLNMKPKTMTGNNFSNWDKLDMFLGRVSGTARRIGSIGGSRSPESVVGIRGSVLGPFPSSVQNRIDTMTQMNTGMNVQRNIPSGAVPEKFMQPGMQGSQVPKYQYSPRTASPGTTWQRVVTVDQYGKKRSALRKVRVPDMQYNRVPIQQEQEVGLYGRNPMGVGFKPENLNKATAMGGTGLDQNMNNIINAIKSGGANNIQQRSTVLTSNSGINFNKDLGMYLR